MAEPSGPAAAFTTSTTHAVTMKLGPQAMSRILLSLRMTAAAKMMVK